MPMFVVTGGAHTVDLLRGCRAAVLPSPAGESPAWRRTAGGRDFGTKREGIALLRLVRDGQSER